MKKASALPAPLLAGELDRCLEQLDAGVPFKAALEELLLSLPVERAEHLTLLMREGRAAWVPLLFGSGGRALFVGNAFSGTAHVLAAAGFRPVLYDPCAQRMRFEAHRCLALTGVPVECVVGGDGPLPFEDQSFELVVQEDGLPGPATGWGHDARELGRVSRGEVVLIADNRLGYKSSAGARGAFEIPSPTRFLARALRPPRGERTLPGYRSALRLAGCAEPHAYALYPHAEDYTHVVDLEGEGPSLHLGPKERRNKLKMAGYTLGLFPAFTPSFALLGVSGGPARRELEGRARRLERVLIELSERLGEEPPVLDELLATRGNTVVLQTRAAHGDLADPLGRWSVHVPLSPTQLRQLERHHRVLERLWSGKRRVPAPEPLYRGTIEGLELCCERRLPGLGAPELSGDLGCLRRTIDCVARDFSRLVVEPPREIDERIFERYFGARFDLVARFAGREETVRNIARLRDETRERVLGANMPLVLYHADLRGKHVHVNREGEVLGYLDWGSSTDRDVPYFDLLQLLVHERKQAAGTTVGHAWRQLLEPEGLRDWERGALERYANDVGVDAAVCAALERCYPIFVAAMAESNWDYSRPRWLHLQFGI